MKHEELWQALYVVDSPVILREGVELLLTQLLDADQTLRLGRYSLRPLFPRSDDAVVVVDTVVEVVVVVHVEGEDTLELVQVRSQITDLVISLSQLCL